MRKTDERAGRGRGRRTGEVRRCKTLEIELYSKKRAGQEGLEQMKKR
jgi:hypothetical protein